MTDPTSPIVYFGEQTGTAARLPVKSLDQNDFLKLLIAQMTSQDPLNPKTDMEMIPQMVQFSALEQAKAMQADIAGLRADQEVLHASSLLGRTVELLEGPDKTVTGRVDAVLMEEGMPKLVVNGNRYYLGQVVQITVPTNP